ncbi:hypothetical protein C6P42_000161 [Pichia californica]|nr:hypothetical protein C6P42_000161 [[Candida] californica]
MLLKPLTYSILLILTQLANIAAAVDDTTTANAATTAIAATTAATTALTTTPAVAAADTTTAAAVAAADTTTAAAVAAADTTTTAAALLIEPALPGISYSFTEDGYWEEAIYQVTSNPKNHSCAAAVLIFQHGTYTKDDNGTLTLTPFDIDGRQLLSQPCDDGGVSLYSRYNQTEVFKAYQVYVDGYHGRWRIDLIKSNGAYLQPLYLAFQPPQMLPTITMNPTASASATNSANKLVRREFGLDLSLSERIQRSLENRYKTNAIKKDSFNYTFWWWTSASLMGLGAALFVLT